jgi:hypothetical protein
VTEPIQTVAIIPTGSWRVIQWERGPALPTSFTCARISSHLRTVAWLVEQMLLARVALTDGRPVRVVISSRARRPS